MQNAVMNVRVPGLRTCGQVGHVFSFLLGIDLSEEWLGSLVTL